MRQVHGGGIASRATAGDRRSLGASIRRDARRLCLSDSVVEESLSGAAMSDLRAVAQIASRQLEVRAQNAPERRMRKARLPAVKSLGGYDFSQVAFPEGYGGADLRSLALVDAGQGFMSHGRTGRGKTHLCVQSSGSRHFALSSFDTSLSACPAAPLR